MKVPFSAQLGFIEAPTLAFNALLIPVILSGLFVGKALVARVPQKWFDTLILGFAIVASVKLIAF
jgi:uncharacterized membrane protein YfcA